MDTKKLRQKILDLAIHGKLVPQDPNDEPASVLLERIRTEKEQLIKEGKIKAPKKSKTAGDTSHYGKDGHFELPEGWAWSSVNDISLNIIYGVSESAKPSGTFKLLRITDIQNNVVDWDNVPFTDFDTIKAKDYLLSDGDILFARTGATVGKSYLANRTPSNAIFASYLIRIQYSKSMLPQYVKFFFESGYYWEQISDQSVGVGQPNVNGTSLGRLSIPVPPLSEQRKIVNEAIKWLSIIDSIEREKNSLLSVLDRTKQTILDLAIHGKLVPQDPSDEPAIDLLRRINPSFTPSHNLHYGVVPPGWALCPIGTATDYGQCVSVQTEKLQDSDWILELEDIEKGTGRLLQRVQKKDRAINGIRHRFIKGQVLYPKLRTYLNKVLIADDDGFCTTEIVPITPYQAITSQYLNIVLRSPYFLDYTARCGYGVKMPRLGTNDARKALLPIPPIPEQQRIVTAVENFFEKLDSIVEILK